MVMAGCRELGLPAVARRWLTAALVGDAGQTHGRAQLVAAPSNSFLLPNKLVLTTQISPSASPHLAQCRCPFYLNGLLLCSTPRVNIIDVANPFWSLGVTGWISVCWQMGRDSLQNGPYCPAERAVRCACMARLARQFDRRRWPQLPFVNIVHFRFGFLQGRGGCGSARARRDVAVGGVSSLPPDCMPII